jgi:cell wall-associated NlpC family hydrolase
LLTAAADAGLPAGWDRLLAELASAGPGERVAAISARFLGTPYRAGTLVGSATTPERLTIELAAVDCFTLLDYVEALRRAAVPGDFRERLVEVRYGGGSIAWEQRRHFFTDWAADPGGRIKDVTAETGGDATIQVGKRLNLRADGSEILPGVTVRERTVRYIPTAAFGEVLLDRLQTGDYLGVYSDAPGLDVSHVGIVVRRDGQVLFRHASSRAEAGRVIDSDLRGYLTGKPGAVILRPR